MTTDELFAKFGGREAVMQITGAARNAANNWRHDGVPFKHWATLIEEAERRKIEGITFDALRGTREKAAA
jgi:hypothetical protein